MTIRFQALLSIATCAPSSRERPRRKYCFARSSGCRRWAWWMRARGAGPGGGGGGGGVHKAFRNIQLLTDEEVEVAVQTHLNQPAGLRELLMHEMVRQVTCLM